LVTVFRRHDDPVVCQLVEHGEPVVGRGDFQGGPGAAAHLQFDRSAVAVGHADVLVPQIDPLTHPLNGEPAVGDVFTKQGPTPAPGSRPGAPPGPGTAPPPRSQFAASAPGLVSDCQADAPLARRAGGLY